MKVSQRLSFSQAPNNNEIVELIRRQARESRRWRRFIWIAMLIVALGLVASVIMERMQIASTGWSLFVEWMPWILVFVGGSAMMMRQELSNSARRASDTNDVRLVGSLTELLVGGDDYEQRLGMQIIGRLLPQFSAEDYDALTPEQRKILLNSISKGSDPRFVLGVLSVAGKFGESDCIQPIEEYAASTNGNSVSLAHVALADIRMRVARATIHEAESGSQQNIQSQ